MKKRSHIMCTVLEKQFQPLYLTGSTESKLELSNKGTWMKPVHPFCHEYSAVFSFERFLRTFLGVS